MTRLDPRLFHGIALALTTLTMLWSWQQGYRGAKRAYDQRHAQMGTLSVRVTELEAMVRAAGNQGAWLAERQQQLATLRGRFTWQAQLPQLLNTLVETLKAGPIKLPNIAQGNLEPVRQADQPLLVGGAPCYQLPVTVTAEGRYYALVEALGKLTAETFPGLVSIQQVEFRRRDPVSPRLDATIELRLYVIGGQAPQRE